MFAEEYLLCVAVAGQRVTQDSDGIAAQLTKSSSYLVHVVVVIIACKRVRHRV